MEEIKPTLVVLAAGMATRYGGLKQLESFGPGGETILEYSVYDAIRSGFGKVVFIIRKTIKTEFQEKLISKFNHKIHSVTVSQELDQLPEGYSLPSDRLKPWGTGHAVLSASNIIKEPFAVINADDFYGYRSYLSMSAYLKNNNDKNRYALVGYPLQNTLSKHGSVSRGICILDDNNNLKSITEHTKILETEKGIISQITDNQVEYLPKETIVSMNMMGFTPTIFNFIDHYFKEFLNQNINNPKAEFYLPLILNQLIKSNQATVKVLPSDEKWFGVTYPDDKPLTISNLRELIQKGAYPKNLWK